MAPSRSWAGGSQQTCPLLCLLCVVHAHGCVGTWTMWGWGGLLGVFSAALGLLLRLQ